MASIREWARSWMYDLDDPALTDREKRALWAENHKSNNKEDREQAVRHRAKEADRRKK
jgi:hypothetical protein